MENEKQMTLRDYVRVLFRHKSVIVVCMVTVMITVIIGLMLKTPVYESTVKMLISAQKQVDSPYYRDLSGQRSSADITLTQAEIVQSDPVIQRSVRAMRLYELPLDYEAKFASPLKSILLKMNVKITQAKLDRMTQQEQFAYRYRMAMDYLRAAITVEPIKDTDMFSIKVQDFSPYGAAVMANIVSRSYVIFDLEQQYAELRLKFGEKNLSVTQLKDNIDRMEKSLNGEPLSNIEAIGPASIKIIEQAQISLKPAGTPRRLTAVLAFFMSIFLSVMLAFVFEYMDPTFKSPMDVENTLNLPLLGFIPQRGKGDRPLLDDAKSRTKQTAPYHALADQLYMMSKDRKSKNILFTAADAKEGTSTIVANLGAILSKKVPLRILLIDANLRHPSLNKLFKISSALGLADVLEGKASFNDVLCQVNSHMHILPAGHTELNPMILLSSSSLQALLSAAQEKYNMVIIDCPNLKSSKDVEVLVGHADGICVVVNESITRREVLKQAIEPLKEKKANFFGVIINNRTFPIPKFVYDRL